MKKVLNLYAGVGGNRKHWDSCEITAVERSEKIANVYHRLYPEDTVVVGDAHEYLRENVVPFYEPLISPSARVGRHLFWSNFDFEAEDIKRPADFINLANLAGKQKLMDWLGIHFEENIYYEGNHCPAQVLRNCVHPDLGLKIFEAA